MVPPPEIFCSEMLMRLLNAVYDIVDAPLRRNACLHRQLLAQGFQQNLIENLLSKFYNNDFITISTHLDNL
eukprot:150948-Heterocapsa_arctica.AAC.1